MKIFRITVAILSLALISSVCYGANIEVTVYNGNVRNGPNTKSQVVGYVRKGDVFPLVNKSGDWFQIKYNNINGWVHKTLAKATDKKPQQAGKPITLPYNNSWALIIGIANYNDLPFQNYAIEDAKYFEGKIQEYGFNKVITLYNEEATKEKIIYTIKKALPKDVGENDRVLIFFAGNAYTKTGGNKNIGYIAPVDASEKTLYKDSISIDELKSMLTAINARHILCIIDSTVSGLRLDAQNGPPYYNKTEKLKEAVSKKGVQLISAGRDFEPMEPYGSLRSLFMKRLIEGLDGDADKNMNGTITGNELGSFLRSIVSYESNNKQLPQFGRWSGKGEIVFKSMGKRTSMRMPYEMVFVPRGTFEMGTPGRLGRRSEKPMHKVYLNPFYIGKYEVANYQYKGFITATNHRAPTLWTDPKYNSPNQPVVGVDWRDASAFCKWMGKRLPTEAEWEKAARGMEWQKYPWGGEPPISESIKRANISEIIGKPSPVGRYRAGKSPYRAHDMSGNVWEWVYDWYDAEYYKQSPKNNPYGPDEPSKENAKALRGGSWNSGDFIARSSYRNWLDAGYRNNDVGFRCAD